MSEAKILPIVELLLMALRGTKSSSICIQNIGIADALQAEYQFLSSQEG